MEFDWTGDRLSAEDISNREIEESFEDPFGIRLLPEIETSRETRYFILGRTISGRALFTVFWTDGKKYRIIFSRAMSPGEEGFYDRKNSDPPV